MSALETIANDKVALTKPFQTAIQLLPLNTIITTKAKSPPEM
jgi:hypothetical protein